MVLWLHEFSEEESDMTNGFTMQAFKMPDAYPEELRDKGPDDLMCEAARHARALELAIFGLRGRGEFPAVFDEEDFEALQTLASAVRFYSEAVVRRLDYPDIPLAPGRE